MYCYNCGNYVPDGSLFCSCCGSSLDYSSGNYSNVDTNNVNIEQTVVTGQSDTMPQPEKMIQQEGMYHDELTDEPSKVDYYSRGFLKNISGNTWMLISVFAIILMFVLGIVIICSRIFDGFKTRRHDNPLNTSYTEYSDTSSSYNNEATTAENADGDEQYDESESNEIPEASNSFISDITASSYLTEEEYDIDHDPSKVIDGDYSTAWCEGVEGFGEGETITIYLNQECAIKGIYILNGYNKDEELYQKNCRPAELTFSFSDGSSETFDMGDWNEWQTCEFDAVHYANYVEITIGSVFEGTKYEDTLITEIELF